MTYEKQNKLHIVSVVAVIRNAEGKYLVLKRRDDEVAYPGMYTFPGGKIEGNDTVEETLAKEILEETGLTMKPGKFLLKDKTFLRPDGQTSKFFSYLCEVVSPEPIVISQDFTDHRWISSADVYTIPHVGIEEELHKADELFRHGFSLSTLQTISVKDRGQKPA